MKNNNGASIRRLSNRSLKNNRMRNIFAVMAIVLTGMLFTAAFSLVSGMMQVAQEQTMHEVGGKFHAGLKAATTQQYEKVTADPLVKESSYNIFLGFAENLVKRQSEIRYTPKEENLADMFITLEEGHLPFGEDEIVVDTFVMDELKIPHKAGEKVPLTFRWMGETIEKEFTVSGWYQGDRISHASEIFISEAYWKELKGERTDEDFVKWNEEHPQDNGVGLMAVNLYFDKASNLEEKIRTVIKNAGYEPGAELNYGVNWAYMSSRIEAVDPLTFVILAGAVVVILLTGYLIIYNIFQISVMADIRFYGLLKTIGTTKKQLHRLVRRQAVILSAMGIPIGLLLGYGIGKAVLPFAMSMMEYGNMEISLAFNPWILIFGAGFSALTVFLSCRKPGKIAGSVSPVEAVKYTEVEQRSKKKKKRSGKFSILSMALANLGRNKKKTAVVVAAISLSMILLTVVMTAVGSFRLDSFMEERIVGDFVLGNVNYTGMTMDGDYEIDREYLQVADAQSGIESKNEMWSGYGKSIKIDEKAREQYRKLEQEGKLNTEEQYDISAFERMMSGEEGIRGFFYGYSDELMENLQVLEGSLDIEKFQSGDYILLTTILGNDCWVTASDHVYHPGDKVTVESITEESNVHEVTDENGEIVDVWYDNLAEKEYEVMAIVEMPYSMNLHRFTSNECDAVLPLREMTDASGSNECFAYSYQVADEDQKDFEAAVKDYSENVDPRMGYLSKDSLKKEFDGMVQVIATIGITLAAVIALIGILNFINAVVTGIISRKREFAMLQSIGMTNAQLERMLVCEGICYVGIAGVISFLLGSLLSRQILSALNHVIKFFEYRFQILPFMIMMPLLLLVAVAGPLVSYQRMRRKSIVERLREAE